LTSLELPLNGIELSNGVAEEEEASGSGGFLLSLFMSESLKKGGGKEGKFYYENIARKREALGASSCSFCTFAEVKENLFVGFSSVVDSVITNQSPLPLQTKPFPFMIHFLFHV
jgi:hypothetical protein